MSDLPADVSSLRESMESFLQNPLPETISELEAQIAVIEAEQKRCADTIKELMAREDFAKGIYYAQEIHELHQQKNMLETHKQYRRVRIGRLNFERGSF